MTGDPFHEGYEQILLEFGDDHEAVKHSYMTEDNLAVNMSSISFENSQPLTLEGVMGRILSSSYMPQPGHPRYEEMSRAVADLFARNEVNGSVRMAHECVVCYGQLN